MIEIHRKSFFSNPAVNPRRALTFMFLIFFTTKVALAQVPWWSAGRLCGTHPKHHVGLAQHPHRDPNKYLKET